MLSAVIPVLNEENTLPLVLANLRQINKLTSAFFILNGCTDKSAEVIKKSKTACRKIIISYPETLGFDIPRDRRLSSPKISMPRDPFFRRRYGRRYPSLP